MHWTFFSSYRPFQVKNCAYDKLAPYRSIFNHGVPILMYHKLGTPPPGTHYKKLYVSMFRFKKQLRQFKKAGFQTASLDDWKTFNNPNNSRLVLTFDDGSRTVFQSACKPLAEAGYSAIQYIVANQIGGRNEWDIVKGELEDPLMDESEIRDWLAAGHQIGAHTLSHPHLTKLTPENAREEIFSSKKKLEDRFGIPIRHFCYPYGSWRPWVRDLVEEAGYETAVTIQPGICADVKDPFTMPRLTVCSPPRTWRTFLSQFRPWSL